MYVLTVSRTFSFNGYVHGTFLTFISLFVVSAEFLVFLPLSERQLRLPKTVGGKGDGMCMLAF